ncbi:hypothetical protein ABZP36_016426 [Zizania latifolia]
MANRCASVDDTWAHLPAPAPSPWTARPTWLSPVGAAFEDDALTAALWASMSPPVGATAAASSSASYCSASPTPSSSTTTTTTSSASAEILAISSARPGNGGGPARAVLAGPTGRVSKRKPRPSRRAHTTYISADPADFRRMVQEVTGYPVSGADAAFAAAASSSTPAPRFASAPACVLPTLDTSAFLLDSASPQQQPERPKNKPTFVSPTMAAFSVADEASSLLQELEAMVSAPPAIASAFPTLESWGMI